MSKHRMPDVVVLLPGITGSVLSRHGKVVWGFTGGTLVKTLFSFGGNLRRALELPHDDPAVDDLDDGITADALMPDLHLLPGLWKIDGYGGVAQALLSSFDLVEGRNFFSFPYDWRRDNRVAARRLARSAHGWLTDWRASSGNADARLILVAHSMGGLVSRYFLECLEGWKDTRALVTFGTPYRGSLNALDSLANGLKKGPIDLSELARQFTSIYQLLPIYPCYDDGGGALARVGETRGIPNVDAARAADALAFHREIERAVELNRTLPRYQSHGYRIHPVVGVVQPTLESARLEGGGVRMLEGRDGTEHEGDGTVPRVSATPIELGNSPANAMFAATRHGSLQNADAVITQLVGILSGLGLDLGGFRNEVRVSMQLDDVFDGTEPVVVKARPSRPETALAAMLWQDLRAAPIATVPMRPGAGGWQAAEFAPLPAGAYRVTVTGTDKASRVEPAEDAFVVTEPKAVAP